MTVSGALTFTAADWDRAQTVTVSAAPDADAANDRATVSHAVSGGGYGSVAAADVAVTVADDETASTGVTLTVSDEAVGEDAGATAITVTGTLNGAPGTSDTAVTVSVSGGTASAGDFAAVQDFTLTIGAGQASGTASFTLTPVDDAIDEGDETVRVAGAAQGLEVTPATVTIEDDDARGIAVSRGVDGAGRRRADLYGGACLAADGDSDGDAIRVRQPGRDGEPFGADLHCGDLERGPDRDGVGGPGRGRRGRRGDDLACGGRRRLRLGDCGRRRGDSVG